MKNWDYFDTAHKIPPWEYHVKFTTPDNGWNHEFVTESKEDAEYRAKKYREDGMTKVSVVKKRHR